MSWATSASPALTELVAVQPEQVEGQGPQRGQHGSAGAAITVFIFMELGIAESVPAFNAQRPSPVAAGLLAWCAGW